MDKKLNDSNNKCQDLIDLFEDYGFKWIIKTKIKNEKKYYTLNKIWIKLWAHDVLNKIKHI
jgi:hypothetical protein